MAHITVPNHTPGLLGLLLSRPRLAQYLTAFLQELLRGESPLSPGERELVALVVSVENRCQYCTRSHLTVARKFFPDQEELVEQVLNNVEKAPIRPAMKMLLKMARQVIKIESQTLNSELVAQAQAHGATEQEIHDTVLVASTIAMINRYVDALGADIPEEVEYYEHTSDYLVNYGYVFNFHRG